MFLVNSRPSRFSAATSCSSSKSNHNLWRPFSRSYGTILPSSLTMVISNTLGYSPRLPVSVCGTDTCTIRLEGFLGSMDPTTLCLQETRHNVSELRERICLFSLPTRLNRDFHHPDGLTFCVTPSLKHCTGGTGILTCCPSTTPFGLALGSDLPWEDQPCPGNLSLSV